MFRETRAKLCTVAEMVGDDSIAEASLALWAGPVGPEFYGAAEIYTRNAIGTARRRRSVPNGLGGLEMTESR